MNEYIAHRILKLLDFSDFDITDIYETSFRAIRKNEYMLAELNVDVTITDYNNINEDNVYMYTMVCTHVLKRYKGGINN